MREGGRGEGEIGRAEMKEGMQGKGSMRLTRQISFECVHCVGFRWPKTTRDTPLRGIYIPHVGQISVKISFLGVQYPYVALMGVKFGKEEGTFGPCSVPNFTLIGATYL